jgi:predicted transposase/invertase (TIGR01784 family)
MASMRRTLDPKLDIVFWMLFGEDRNRSLLVSLLTAVLRPSAPIEVVEVLRSEPERSIAADKIIALDVRARLANGEQVDIEMQSQRRPALSARILYYWARLYAGQLSRGDDYAVLRRAAVVVFANFSWLSGRRLHSLFRLHERQDAELLTDQLEIHVIELPKLNFAALGEDEPSLLFWSKFLTATDDEQLERLAMEHPVLNQAKLALDALSADPEARRRAEQRETALLMHQADLGTARDEGRAEGRLEGRAEGRLEGRAEGRLEGRAEGRLEGRTEGRLEGKASVLSRLLVSRFGSLPESLAQRVVDATETELDRWLERSLFATSVTEVFEA